MTRIAMPVAERVSAVDSPNKPSPHLYRSTTMSGSYSQESRPDLNDNNGTLQYHYQVPNLSSMLYEYTNREKDRVGEAFRTGNYNSIRDLPRHLMPGNVSQWSKSKIESNLYNQVEERSYIELQNGGGFFSKFLHHDDPFERYLEQATRDRIAHQE